MEDRSVGKETRNLTPFLDLLDLHDLILAEDDAGAIAKAALPGRLAPSTVPKPAANSDPGQDGGKLMPLPAAPAAPQPDADAPTVGMMAPAQAAMAQPLTMQATGAVSSAGAAVAKGAHGGAAPAKAAKEPGSPSHDSDGDDAHDLDGIRVRIDQDADVDQDAEAEVTIRAGNADVSIRIDADAEVDQRAAVFIQAETAMEDGAVANVSEEASIAGRQDVDIDTVVRVDVTGYTGEVVITIGLGEQADVDQRALAVFQADAGHDVFDVDISQHIDVDLQSLIDIEVREIGGRLHINLLVNDIADGEDVMQLEISESSDDILDVSLRQLADLDQRVSVNLDVEQELAKLFDIDVDVDADSDVHVTQIAVADAKLGPDGQADWDLDGESRIEIDNQLHIRIDFNLT